MKHYENVLPEQYVEIDHVRFDDVKTGFLYDLKAVLPGILLTIIGWIIVRPTIVQVLVSLVIFAVSIYPYFSLHEIVHGVVIKVMTGQRVEIGFNKSGAYCGMPELYMYRPVAVRCTAAPLVVFSILFGIGDVILIAADNWMSLPLGLLLTLHLLGCRSDVNLLKIMEKYHDDSLLIKDTGAEQWFFSLRKEG